jgi:hypothetical protein
MNSHLKGVIDVHCHCGPDSIRRNLDALQLAEIALSYGMRGVVLKNHFEPTASLAYMVRKQIPEIAAFGGVTLNLASGGMNADAVRHMATVDGGWGRFVWMGSLDTESHLRHLGHDRACVPVSRDGFLLPEVKEVLEVIAKHQLVLATGHCSTDEAMLLIREAKKLGIRRILVTHAMMAPTHMPVACMCEAADLGALIEFVYNGLIGVHKEFEPHHYAEAIRAIGAERCVLVSDLGQVSNPPHPEGLLAFLAAMQREGIRTGEIDRMTKFNPAVLLGLEQ